MKNRVIIFAIITFLLAFVPLKALAQQASDSATPSAQEIQKSLTDRIKKAIQGNINSNSTEPILKAFVGTVSSIAENTITISTTNQETKHITVSDATTIVRGSTKVKLDSVKIGEGIIGMGLTSDFKSQDAIRIVLFTPATPKFQRSVLTGTITNVDLTKQQITITPPGSTNATNYDLSTKQLSVFSNGFKKIKASFLSNGQKIVAIVFTNTQTQKNTITQILALDNSQPTSPTPVRSTCGDGVCQNIVCQGIGCPQPETPETCPADCTK